MDLYEEFKDRRKDFEILAFHDTNAKSFAELDPKMAELKTAVWNGRELPFPILLDATGETLKTFEVNSFPTVIAIDPSGNIVRGGGEETLRAYLMDTDPAVQKTLKQLAGAKGPAFAKAVDEAAKAGGRGAYALVRFSKDAKPDAMPVLVAALAKMKGPYVAGFFLGDRGLGSKDRKERLEAARVLGEIAERDLLYSIVQFANAEKDEEVKKAIGEAIMKIQSR